MLHHWAREVVRFLKEEDGPTTVEYAVQLFLIVCACITVVDTLGDNASATFNKVSTAVKTSSS